MILNPDLHYDLAREIFALPNKNLMFITRFLISGRELLIAMKNFVSKADLIRIQNWQPWGIASCLRYSSFLAKFHWENFLKIEMDLRDPYMKFIIEWALSSVKEVEILISSSLPADVTELLLRNPNFSKFQLDRCDLPSAKLLLESRKFEFITTGSCVEGSLDDIHIDSEELEFYFVSLEDILESKFINTKSLIINTRNEDLAHDFSTMEVGLGFHSVERFKLETTLEDVLFCSENILKFLGFLNTKFPNLKLITLDFDENRNLIYKRSQKDFDMPLDSFIHFINYRDKLSSYDGRVQISRISVENYLQKFKDKFPDFQFSSEIKRKFTYHDFKKPSNIAQNFELNHWKSYDVNNQLRRSLYSVEISWDNEVQVSTKLKDVCMGYMLRWILSSVKEVLIDYHKPLPTEVTDLLLKNPNFTRLGLRRCDLSIAKSLIEHKKWDCICMTDSIIRSLADVRIDTEVLELYNIPLEEILNMRFIKTNFLVCKYSNEKFNDSLLLMNIESNFGSLEKLELVIRNRDQFFDPQRVFRFLDFLNTKFVNLKCLNFIFGEYRPNICYNKYRRSFNMPLASFKSLFNNEENFTVYNGRIKVTLSHVINFELTLSKKPIVEHYCSNLRKQLQEFEYYSKTKGRTTYYSFKKFSNISENFKLNNEIQLTYWDRYSSMPSGNAES
ncbi:hypothetical protein FO519_006344 [Halicephalobus sp. NKZ332]|nr:hypothetical protein FO519_006344 [Halicephalobus sp. NKZ332]